MKYVAMDSLSWRAQTLSARLVLALLNRTLIAQSILIQLRYIAFDANWQ